MEQDDSAQLYALASGEERQHLQDPAQFMSCDLNQQTGRT